MGKMTQALLLVFAIELALSIFMTSNAPTDHTSLFNFLFNPDYYGTDAWFGKVASMITELGAASLVVVGLFYFLRIEVLYAGLVIAMFTFMLNITRLWSMINSQGVFGAAHAYWASIICAPLLIFYTMACLDYIRSPNS